MEEKDRLPPRLSQRIFEPEPRRNPVLAYGIATLAVLTVAVFESLSWPLLRPSPLFAFYSAVMIAAWYGGFGAGLAATLLSGFIAHFYLIAPFGTESTQVAGQLRLGIYLLIGSLISILTQSLYAARTQEAARAAHEKAARQKAEAERQSTLEALETITDGFIMVDHEMRYTFVNPRAGELLRASPETLVGNTVFDLFPATGALPALRELKQAMEHQVPVCVESFYAPYDTWFESYIYPSNDGFTALIRDITDRKRSVDALRESEERLRQALHAGRMGTWDWDAITGKVEWSESLERIFGLEPGSFGGGFQNWVDLLHPEDREDVLRSLEESMRTRDEHHVEHRLVRPDGRVRWVEGIGRVIRDPAGRVVRVVGVTMDVTDRKVAEAEVRRTVADLERSNSELNQFASIISHDLRGPLQTVSLYVQLIERKYQDQLPGEAPEYLHYMRTGLSRMGSLVEALLDYSKVGRDAAQKGPTDLNHAFDRVVASLQGQVLQAKAQVTHAPLPTVPGDPQLLETLFQNLLENSIKFCGPEPCRVHVWADRAADRWTVSFRDNGVGIDPKKRHLAMQIFQRLDPRPDQPGTGIGLAICKKIVELHGGRIWIEGDLGEGTTVHFTLPA